MPDKPTKPGFKKPATPKIAPRPGRKPKEPEAAPSGKTVRVGGRETELLGRINSGLPEPQARRLEALDARREEETLTPEEHAELLGLVDESERLAVGRAEALVELARHRGTTVPSLMRELGLEVARRG
jgi:hypothetical protein